MIKYLIPTTSKHYQLLVAKNVFPKDLYGEKFIVVHYDDMNDSFEFGLDSKSKFRCLDAESEYAAHNGYVYFQDQESLDQYLALRGQITQSLR